MSKGSQSGAEAGSTGVPVLSKNELDDLITAVAQYFCQFDEVDEDPQQASLFLDDLLAPKDIRSDIISRIVLYGAAALRNDVSLQIQSESEGDKRRENALFIPLYAISKLISVALNGDDEEYGNIIATLGKYIAPQHLLLVNAIRLKDSALISAAIHKVIELAENKVEIQYFVKLHEKIVGEEVITPLLVRNTLESALDLCAGLMNLTKHASSLREHIQDRINVAQAEIFNPEGVGRALGYGAEIIQLFDSLNLADRFIEDLERAKTALCRVNALLDHWHRENLIKSRKRRSARCEKVSPRK
ncbi:MAG: hypothetical protein HRF49_06870 [bacterium]